MINREHVLYFFDDWGLRFSIIVCAIYFIFLKPYDGNLPIYENKMGIYSLSIPVIIGIFAFCYIVINYQRELTKNAQSGFYKLLDNEGFLTEILWFHRWNMRISFCAIVSIILFGFSMILNIFGKPELGIFSLIPVFFITWVIGEVGYFLWLSQELNRLNLKYNRKHPQ